MIGWIVNWLLNAVSLLIVARVIRGIQVDGFGTAMVAALVIGFVNATIGLMLKIVTFPLAILTLGIFLLVVNALMLKLAAALVPGFRVKGFLPAFLGAILLALVSTLLHWVAALT
ncbi:MAG: phage holin family protein [Acidobacteriota bacterium]|nr:phage holin family protein [Acidobacteriota bacterium]